MKSCVVGIGECMVSDDVNTVLSTYALGSCVAVVIHDPLVQVGGLLHYILPDSRLDSRKAGDRPYAYADTGVPLLFKRALQLGAAKSRLRVAVVGGAQVIRGRDSLRIGNRNLMALRRMFSEAGIVPQYEQIGGSISRSVRLHVGYGALVVRCGRSQTVLENAWNGGACDE